MAMTNGVDGQGPAKRGELFISRAGKDKKAAIFIATSLREAGYSTFLQDEDFGHESFMARMKEGFDKVDGGGRVVALLSSDYMSSEYCLKEAHYPLIGDPFNKRQRLVVLRLEDCEATGFLRDIPWFDLTKLLHDADSFARAVRGAIDPVSPEAGFADIYRRAPIQILHPEIRPVPGFTGREDLLDAIDRALWQQGGAAALTNAQSAAVHGLGGVGKSSLAQEWAWRNRARYRGVWWLRAETEQTILDDLIALGSRLISNLAEIPERDRAAQLALDEIERAGAETSWLLVYDNAETPTALSKLTPRSGAHRLITSRWPGWKGHAEALAVDVFPPEVAIDYLMADSGHSGRDAAARLAEALGRLPLALAHARAYCAECNVGFDWYRERIAERLGDDDNPVVATFSLAMERLVGRCPEVETLMGIAAFLAPDRIPLCLITSDVIDEAALNKAVRALRSISLITHETLVDGSRGFSVHRLVQEVMKGRLGSRRQATHHTAVRLMHKALETFSVQEHTNWLHVAPLVPHAVAILELATDIGDGAEIVAGLCVNLDLYFSARGDYAAATSYSERALGIREKALGPDHPNVGASLNNLAELYVAQGRYQEAEPLFERALDMGEKALGPDHPAVGAILSNLAGIYRARGRYQDAEPLVRRTLQIDEKMYGPDHREVGIDLGNLAELLVAQGSYQEAEPLFERALAIGGKALGPDHPDVATSLNNLALLYHTQGRHQEAEPLYQRALDIRQKALGPDHPNVATSLNNLAGLYRDQGRHRQAEPLLERALAIGEKALGPDHPDVATRLNNLALLYHTQGRHQEAEPLYDRALAISEKSLGSDHPNTKMGRANYDALKATMAAKGGAGA